MSKLTWGLLAFAAVGWTAMGWSAVRQRRRRGAADPGVRPSYVYIEDDGSARELTMATTTTTPRRATSLALVLLAACAPERGSDAERAAPATPPVAASPAPKASGRPWYLEPDCGFDTTTAHPEPVALVREFVSRDGRGEFTGDSPWLLGAYICPGELPGPDSFFPIDTMEVLAAGAVVRADSAWVPVRYVLLGHASMTAFEREATPRVVVDTFVVARTERGWRVVSPDMPERVLASVALTWDGLADSTRAAIRAAADAARARRTTGRPAS